jgi:hypothetical protein
LLSLSGSTNNGVITLDGSVPNATVESNFTFDGSTCYINGDVGIGVASPSYKLQVNGSFAALTKSFDIPHPTKQNKRLVYASLEGPENGVYVRGLNLNNTIILPDYWVGLVFEDTITINITPIGKDKLNKIRSYSVQKIQDNIVYLYTDSEDNIYHFYYTVFAERKDVPKLKIERDS